MNNTDKGRAGEDIAVKWLEARGYIILAKNWRNRHLEIDIIASKDKEIVFIEVKTRFSSSWGAPWEAVNQKKRRLIMTAADVYLRTVRSNLEPRFDILSVLVVGGEGDVLHIPNAFHPLRN